MKIVVISDVHSNDRAFNTLAYLEQPDIILSAGDLGDDIKTWYPYIEGTINKRIFKTIFGNHDDLSFILDKQFWIPDYPNIIDIAGYKVSGVNGNFAEKKIHPWHRTNEEINKQMLSLDKQIPVDIIISHECVYGYQDMTYRKSHGGQPILLEVLKLVKPKIWIQGHIGNYGVTQYDHTIIANVDGLTRGIYGVISSKLDKVKIKKLFNSMI